MFDDKGISQKINRAVMENDRKVRAATYHSIAASAVDDERGGRYATEGSKQTVIGSSPIAYPKQPAGSPWASNPYPEEPLIDGRGEGNVLGYEIDRPDVTAAPEAEPTPTSYVVRRRGFVRRI